MSTYRDPVRVRLGRRVQRLGRYIAHGGRPHQWHEDEHDRSAVRCCRCGAAVKGYLLARHGGLAGRCPKQ